MSASCFLPDQVKVMTSSLIRRLGASNSGVSADTAEMLSMRKSSNASE